MKFSQEQINQFSNFIKTLSKEDLRNISENEAESKFDFSFLVEISSEEILSNLLQSNNTNSSYEDIFNTHIGVFSRPEYYDLTFKNILKLISVYHEATINIRDYRDYDDASNDEVYALAA
jgi:hypothetical protein